MLRDTALHAGWSMAEPVDLFVIGGGINGCGIARDAAGRGLKVTLAEMGDLAQATSSASTKLFHGGLRYLEYYEFRLVREALRERETLLVAMPHIAWPLRFVLPHHRGLRPAWLLRLGLFIYDHLGGRRILPATRTLDLRRDPAGAPLRAGFIRGFEYSDCWVEDSRLVALNARDAAGRGARILTRCRVTAARRGAEAWQVELAHADGRGETVAARALVNAAGPWAGQVVTGTLGLNTPARIRLVRGSHIVTRRLFDHDRAYILQGADGRIVFAIPYETDFTLVGTTDVEHAGDPALARCSEVERDYLCALVSEYFRRPVTPADVVWTYSGVRPLYDDGAKSATAATRDYVLQFDTAGPPALNVYGGKITTYRRLAEAALARLATAMPLPGGPWTAGVALPGGDFAVDGVAALADRLRAAHPFLTSRWALRLVRAYGTEAADVLGGAPDAAALGRDFGATLTEAEVRWLMAREFARTAADVVWRRSKLGLRMTADEIAALDAFMSGAEP
ncbi:MAG: glycerol-3-phosphate dehydrogenase [Rhodobacteraceae bacterium]|jgi:glycerol-3-phosphate dehydrogenase|nr:glycerol-3-phosphate dehydrogenase [Paracoccaceae bacterium]